MLSQGSQRGDESLRVFLDQAGSRQLLDRHGEVALAQTIERGRAATHALEAGVDDLERRRLERIVEDGARARRRFVEANLRLVVAVARSFEGRGLALADLVQEGNAGLMRAVDGFDWRRGFKFSTYAVWWIRQAIQRALSEQGHTLRLSSSGADDLARVQSAIGQFEERHQRRPTTHETAAEAGLSITRVQRVLDAVTPLVSLDVQVGGRGRHDDSDGDTLGNLLVDDSPPVDEIAERATYRFTVERMMGVLDAREGQVVRMRFGLDGKPAATTRELARELGLSAERVRQIEARALSKLRHPSVERGARALLAG
jgi:RNA polymerase sigma factor (sigma-70 family)